MIDFINGLSNGAMATTGLSFLLLFLLVAVFTLLDRRAVVAGLGLAYLCVFLLMRGVTLGPIVFLEIVTGFFVTVILGTTLWQLQPVSESNDDSFSLLLRLVTALIGVAFVWVVAQVVGSLPPLPDGIVVAVFALCGLGLWLAIIGREVFRSGIGLLLFLNGLLLLLGLTQSAPRWVGVLATLQLIVALVMAGLMGKGLVSAEIS